MNYLSAVTRGYGFKMADREPLQEKPKSHDFIPAAQFLREKPLTASLFDLAVSHVDSSKRFAKSYRDYQAVGDLFLPQPYTEAVA